jgi:putative ABC transport system permease protein
MSLALSTLIYEWRRYMAAVIALAFSGLLVLAQIGMFLGVGKAFTANIDRSPAEIMVLPPKSENLFSSGGQPRRVLPLVYMHPEVVQALDLAGDITFFTNIPAPGAERKRSIISTLVVDPYPGAVTLPVDFGPDMRQILSEPGAVAIDASALGRLGVKLGDKAIISGHTITVAAVLKDYPNLLNPMIAMSRQTASLIGIGSNADRMGPLMVRIRHPERAEQVRDELTAMSDGAYRAWTRKDLAKANEKDLLKNQLVGIMLLFSITLGFIIGLGITWQTLRGAIAANIKEFASLRALGVSMGSLRLVVMELAFWIGVIGLGATAGLVWIAAQFAAAGGLPMTFPLWAIVMTGFLLIGIAVISGLLSLGVLKNSQPADLLR